MKEDHTGQVFGSLTVLREAKPKGKHRIVTCKCKCGKVKNLYLQHVKSGRTKSCGCVQNKVRQEAKKRSFANRVQRQSSKA